MVVQSLITHPVSMVFNLIMIVPLLPSCCGFFFVFGHEASFFGGFQCSSVDGCSTASCNFGIIAGWDLVFLQYKILSSTLPSWTRSLLNSLFLKYIYVLFFNFNYILSWFLLYNISQKRYSLNWSLPPSVISDYFWQFSLFRSCGYNFMKID